MIKYPRMYMVDEFYSMVEHVPELLDMEGYVEPKYDGSNITCYAGVCLTRNLNPLHPSYADKLKRALGDKYDALMKLSMHYQVFLELGGYRLSPAGYRGCWERELDYVVFDIYAGVFFRPEKVEAILDEYGLKFVEYERMRVRDVLESWKQMLGSKFVEYEGFVLKVYVGSELLKKIRLVNKYHGHPVVFVKFKHEYTGMPPPWKTRKRMERKARKQPTREQLPDTEVYGAINKAHMVLGEEIFDKKKAMPLIFKLVREEAKKHGCAVPKAGKLFKMYQEYLKRIKQ